MRDHLTDQTEATKFMAEVLSQFMKGRNFPSQNQARMIYKDLYESCSLLQERTQYFTCGDQFIKCLPNEDRCMSHGCIHFTDPQSMDHHLDRVHGPPNRGLCG